MNRIIKQPEAWSNNMCPKSLLKWFFIMGFVIGILAGLLFCSAAHGTETINLTYDVVTPQNTPDGTLDYSFINPFEPIRVYPSISFKILDLFIYDYYCEGKRQIWIAKYKQDIKIRLWGNVGTLRK